jgi:hypothetical protein
MMSSLQPAAGEEGAVPAQASPVQPPIGQPIAPPARCKNCDAVLLGHYCSNCSQPADVHVPTTMELIHELMEGITHSDSRLWRTLRCLVLQPGKLTQEFVAGRRVAYLPPFRLYLVLSVIFFLLASLSHTRGEFISFKDTASTSAPPSDTEHCDQIKFEGFLRADDLNQRLIHACKEIVRDNGANLVHVALGTLSKAMFIFLPLIACLNMLLYWHPRYRYAEHLLFFVHLHALYFLAAILLLGAIDAAHAWPNLQGAVDTLQTVLGWLISIYTVIAVRRVFAKSWKGAFTKSVALFVVYVSVFALTVGGVFVYALLQI